MGYSKEKLCFEVFMSRYTQEERVELLSKKRKKIEYSLDKWENVAMFLSVALAFASSFALPILAYRFGDIEGVWIVFASIGLWLVGLIFGGLLFVVVFTYLFVKIKERKIRKLKVEIDLASLTRVEPQ